MYRLKIAIHVYMKLWIPDNLVLFLYLSVLFLCFFYFFCLWIILSTLVIKHIGTQAKCNNDGNRTQPLKRLFETLFLAMKKCTGFTTDVYVVLYTKCICILHVNKVPYILFLISPLIFSDEKTRGGYSARSLFE